MYDVADGEAHRLREQLAAALDDGRGDSTARIDDHKYATCPACGNDPEPMDRREGETKEKFAERLGDRLDSENPPHRTITAHNRGPMPPRQDLQCGGCGEVLVSTDANVVGLLEERDGDPE